MRSDYELHAPDPHRACTEQEMTDYFA